MSGMSCSRHYSEVQARITMNIPIHSETMMSTLSISAGKLTSSTLPRINVITFSTMFIHTALNLKWKDNFTTTKVARKGDKYVLLQLAQAEENILRLLNIRTLYVHLPGKLTKCRDVLAHKGAWNLNPKGRSERCCEKKQERELWKTRTHGTNTKPPLYVYSP